MAATDDTMRLMEEMEDKPLTLREAELRWNSHQHLHDMLDADAEKSHGYLQRALETALADHAREHVVHQAAHDREHTFTQEALNKADQLLDKQLSSVDNELKTLKQNANLYLTRELYDRAHQDLADKMEQALDTLEQRHEALIKSILNRHDSDYNGLRDMIQSEREIRKALEGSLNTWKWLASFLGASGIAGIILLFATRGG